MNEKPFISDSAEVTGNVEIGKGSSVWPNTTIRSDSFILTNQFLRALRG